MSGGPGASSHAVVRVNFTSVYHCKLLVWLLCPAAPARTMLLCGRACRRLSTLCNYYNVHNEVISVDHSATCFAATDNGEHRPRALDCIGATAVNDREVTRATCCCCCCRVCVVQPCRTPPARRPDSSLSLHHGRHGLCHLGLHHRQLSEVRGGLLSAVVPRCLAARLPRG